MFTGKVGMTYSNGAVDQSDFYMGLPRVRSIRLLRCTKRRGFIILRLHFLGKEVQKANCSRKAAMTDRLYCRLLLLYRRQLLALELQGLQHFVRFTGEGLELKVERFDIDDQMPIGHRQQNKTQAGIQGFGGNRPNSIRIY